MTAALATLVAFPKSAALVSMVDLFASKELSKPFHKKRTPTNDDLDTMQLYAKLTKKKELEVVLTLLGKEEEIQ